MDYKEEQKNEIEALDSIYCGDMEILATEPNYRFKIPIKSEEYEPDTENGLCCSLKFAYAPKYPETVPELEILDRENFDEEDELLLKEHILKQAEENLGMVMIFTLVSAAQEWLNEKWDDKRREKEEAVLRKQKEEEEAEMRRVEGTHVTVESFLSWKTKFDLERRLLKKLDKDEKDLKKLTGKQLFMADRTLDQSDLKFLEEACVVNTRVSYETGNTLLPDYNTASYTVDLDIPWVFLPPHFIESNAEKNMYAAALDLALQEACPPK